MKIIKSIIIAFSLYSRIPMPVFTWQEKDMEHAISALSLVGAVIGGLSFAVFKIAGIFGIPDISIVLILSVLPLIVTGGFHMDGFMDVQDAKNSYQDKQRKLEIMKDPHIGAFSVISILVYGMIWLAFIYILLSKVMEKGNFRYLYIYFSSFFCVRALCGLTSVLFQKAKKDGMLNTETGRGGMLNRNILLIETVLGIILFLYFDLIAGAICTAGLLIFTVYYKGMCSKEFGGVTGDTAGYYVCTAEEVVVICLAICVLLL